MQGKTMAMTSLVRTGAFACGAPEQWPADSLPDVLNHAGLAGAALDSSAQFLCDGLKDLDIKTILWMYIGGEAGSTSAGAGALGTE